MKKNSDENAGVRLDKWLFVARFYKTRAQATAAVKQGKILYNNQKPNPSRDVAVGASLTINFGDSQKTVMVKALDSTRKSASIAQSLYEETPQSIEARALQLSKSKEARLLNQTAPRALKRPEGRDRKKMRNIRRTSE